MVVQFIKRRQGKKLTRIALTKLFGIGNTLSNQVCDTLGISNQKLKDLNSNQLDRLSSLLTNNYFVGHELKKIIKMDTKRLKNIKCFRAKKL